MNFFEATNDETFRATHELGHAIIAEHMGIGWNYISIDHADKDKGGCIQHDDIEPTEENCTKFVLMKMAGEAIIRSFGYGQLLALSSSVKYDRADVNEFLKKVYPKIDNLQSLRCMERAVAQNYRFFKRSDVRKAIELLVVELVNLRTMTYNEYLKIKGTIASSI